MRLGMYLVVRDLAVSTAFYAELLGTQPYVVTDRFAGFGMSGTLLAIFTEDAYPRELVRGNNAVPYIRVDDLDAELERIRRISGATVGGDSVDEGVIRLFVFTDPDGNLIELYSLTAET